MAAAIGSRSGSYESDGRQAQRETAGLPDSAREAERTASATATVSATVSYPQDVAGECLPRRLGIPRSSNTEARIFNFQGTIGCNSFTGATSNQNGLKQTKTKTRTWSESHASKSIFEANQGWQSHFRGCPFLSGWKFYETKPIANPDLTFPRSE